jgi:hypothetical protein
MSAERLALLFVLPALVLSGCIGMEAGTPEERVEAALERFQDDMGPDGAIQKLRVSAQFEGNDMDVVVENGRAGAVEMVANVMMYDVRVLCIGDRMFLTVGGETYESRAQRETCDMSGDTDFELPLMRDEEHEVVEVVERDGALEATVRVVEEGEESTITVVVRAGRVVEIRVIDSEGDFTMHVEYGARRAMQAPSASGRMPMSVSWDHTFVPGTYSGTISEVDAVAPLSEFSVQILEGYGGAVAAEFPTGTAGSQVSAGFVFMFEDDGDGMLSVGDRFTVENADWSGEWERQVAFFDHWAGMRTDENPIPAPFAALLVVLLVALVAMRRR